MKPSCLASLFHDASNRDNMYHYPHCPSGSDSWWKYNADIEPKTPKLIKLGKIFQKTLFIKKSFLELCKDTELEKCLHGKSQNANEIFNGTIWERVPKNTFVTLPNLKFELGVYDAVAHFNGQCSKPASVSEKQTKLKLQILRAEKISRIGKLIEKEDHLYVLGGF